MNAAAGILRLLGWKLTVTVPDYPKCIICVAPHTSNWDFILGKLAYAAVGRRAGFLMKEDWFFWPLGPIFRAIGGIPVPRSSREGRESLTASVIRRFKESARLHLAITPEGTRSLTRRWHTGFLRIAYGADVPVVLGVLDFGKKEINIEYTMTLTGDVDKDLRAVKDFYSGATGKYPEKFSTEDEPEQ